MYSWYQRVADCYAYLVDVPSTKKSSRREEQVEGSPPDGPSGFPKSRWFTHGWTLQELIAPATVIFYDKYWTQIGTKSSLRTAILRACRVDVRKVDQHGLASFSIAQKMSWVATRETTRTEDTAYCLMGLFNVNMPLIYGEGKKAFRRLQEVIMQNSSDRTIFAWQTSYEWTSSIQTPYLTCSILAEEPSAFMGSGLFADTFSQEKWPYTSTKSGIRMDMPVLNVSEYFPELKDIPADALIGLLCAKDAAFEGSIGCSVSQPTYVGIILTQDRSGVSARVLTPLPAYHLLEIEDIDRQRFVRNDMLVHSAAAPDSPNRSFVPKFCLELQPLVRHGFSAVGKLVYGWPDESGQEFRLQTLRADSTYAS